ncbi:MAG: hypothetical protein HGA75_09980 [Thiobacillus sp.]|nr:hypothetical protein [Thiobacillus sp.]
MLTGLLNAVGSLLGTLVDLVGGILGSLTQALTPTAAVADTAIQASVQATEADSTTTAYSQIEAAIDSTSEEATDLLDAAIDGTDQLMETGIVDSARALGELAQDLAGLTVTTTTTYYRPDGTVSSVVEQVSHEPGALLMMQFVNEVLAPQVSGMGEGISLFMQQTGAGMEDALGNLTAYDLSYTTTAFGTSLLVIDRI